MRTLVIALLLTTFGLTAVAQSIYEQATEASALEEDSLVLLKTHENAFGSARYSSWDNRKIHDAQVTVREGVRINGATDWRLDYVVTGKEFRVEDFDVDEDDDQVKIKLQATNVDVGTELNLTIPGIDNLLVIASALFSSTRGGIEDYRSRIEPEMIDRHIDSAFDTTGVTDEQKQLLLAAITELPIDRIQVEAEDEELFVRLPFRHGTQYNTRVVNKSQRLASTIQEVLRAAKSLISEDQMCNEFLAGYTLYWTSFFRDFVDEKSASGESIELSMDLFDFEDYADGDMSAFDLVSRSKLRVAEELYTLTSWEPIQ